MNMKKVTLKHLLCSFMLLGSISASAQNITEGAKLTAEFPSSNPVENVSKLVDNNLSTKFCIRNVSAMWFKFELTAPVMVTKYTISSANDMPDRDPKAWILQGSDDGLKWKDLDVKKEEKFNSRRVTNTYEFPNSVAYKFYRLNVTESNGASFLQFSEWNLIK
ncbi:F5/8 type C domain-containing protein [Pedobacter sp. ok626]|nr:F5/8 type C domain-containing protein [Pedobacter sp. ok626]